MKAKDGKDEQTPGGKKPGKTSGARAPLSGPTKDAPFDVDLNDDGDFASPKPDVSEEELKEREDRRR